MDEIINKVIEANRNTVLSLFNHRCGLNMAHPATTIHEIEPRSIRPTDWWELDNMISLCAECHQKVHNEGTKKWRSVLRGKRVFVEP